MKGTVHIGRGTLVRLEVERPLDKLSLNLALGLLLNVMVGILYIKDLKAVGRGEGQ